MEHNVLTSIVFIDSPASSAVADYAEASVKITRFHLGVATAKFSQVDVREIGEDG